MKILLTGGAGFIGSHVLQLAAQREDAEVVVLDNLSSGRREHIPPCPRIRLQEGDVRDAALADSLFAAERFDAVIHLAAQTMVPYSLQHPQEDCEVNLLGVLNILEACRKHRVGRIVFSSSAAVYGDNPHVPLKETEAPLPLSCYGLTKLATEHYLRLYHGLYGISAAVLRFANVYGERQGAGGEGGVISIFCKLLAQGKGVTVYGSGEQTRDYVYAGDIAEALLRALTLDGYHIINISTRQETSLLELLEAFRQAAGQEFPVQFAPARAGDIFRSVLDNAACRQHLQFCPRMSLREGIERTYADYLRVLGERRKSEAD